jgi:pheromone shutdown-related protein TraB
MTDESRWRKLDIFQVLKQKKVLFLMSNLALSAFQRRLGERLGVKPGAELMAAVECSREANATLVLVDRDIQATLKRTWARLGFFRKLGLLNELLAGFFSKEELTEAELERMKDRDVLSDMLAEFARQAPEIKGPLIDERDLWLASSVYEAPGQTVVAVVGAGHVPGMVAHFGAPVDRAALAVIPPPGPVSQALQWLVPAALVGLLVYGVMAQGESERSLQELLLAWILPTAVGGAAGTAAALAHPLTVLAGFLSAPLTTLHPAIAAGMVTGPLEAWRRRPTVADCEAVRDDADTLKGWYGNPFLRVLLVFFLSNLGAAIGAWIGLGALARLVAG